MPEGRDTEGQLMQSLSRHTLKVYARRQGHLSARAQEIVAMDARGIGGEEGVPAPPP